MSAPCILNVVLHTLVLSFRSPIAKQLKIIKHLRWFTCSLIQIGHSSVYLFLIRQCCLLKTSSISSTPLDPFLRNVKRNYTIYIPFHQIQRSLISSEKSLFLNCNWELWNIWRSPALPCFYLHTKEKYFFFNSLQIFTDI